MENIKSKVEYKKGTILQDDGDMRIFKVLSCNKNKGYDNYSVKIIDITKSIEQKNIIKDLKKALNHIKIHDKDLFMLDNIISTLEDTI